MKKTINEVSIYCRCQRTSEQDRLMAAFLAEDTYRRIRKFK